MKKILLAVLTVVIANSNLHSQDFRNVSWGMSLSQVKSSEQIKPIEESSEYLVYEITLAQFDTYLVYFFTDNNLIRARYVINENHINVNDYISDYNILSGFLQKKYGEPIEEEEKWNSESTFKNDKSFWGHSIRQGDLVLYKTYTSQNTDIGIWLGSEDYEVLHIIEYSSTKPDHKSIEERKILKDF